MNISILKNANINYDSGVGRFIDDSDMYESFLADFVNDTTAIDSEKFLKERKYEDLFMQMHTLKGVSGNLDLTELYNKSCELVEYLRNNNAPDYDKASELFNNVLVADKKMKDAIKSAM